MEGVVLELSSSFSGDGFLPSSLSRARTTGSECNIWDSHYIGIPAEFPDRHKQCTCKGGGHMAREPFIRLPGTLCIEGVNKVYMNPWCALEEVEEHVILWES